MLHGAITKMEMSTHSPNADNFVKVIRCSIVFSKTGKGLHLAGSRMVCVPGNGKCGADWLQIILGD